MSRPLNRMGKKPRRADSKDPMVDEIFNFIDAKPDLFRGEAFAKAGYPYVNPHTYANGSVNIRLNMFRDVAESIGFKLILTR